MEKKSSLFFFPLTFSLLYHDCHSFKSTICSLRPPVLPYSSRFSQITHDKDDKGLPNLQCFLLLGELVLCFSFAFLSQHLAHSKMWVPIQTARNNKHGEREKQPIF